MSSSEKRNTTEFDATDVFLGSVVDVTHSSTQPLNKSGSGDFHFLTALGVTPNAYSNATNV